MQLLCSTGAFGRNPTLIDYRDIVLYGPLLPVNAFEIMYYTGWFSYLEMVAEALQASQLRFSALHAEKDAGPHMSHTDPEKRELGRKNLLASCRLAQMLGSKVVVFHLWGMSESDERLERNLAILPECVEIALAHDQILAVETIPCNKSTPLDVLQRVIEAEPRCRVALDTEFLAHHNQVEAALDADWLWSSNLVQHIHLKDYDGQMFTTTNYRRYLHPGEGQLDFSAIFARLRSNCYVGNLSLEASVVAPDGTRDIPKLQTSLRNLRQAIQNAQRLVK